MSSQVYLMLLRHPFPDSEAMLVMQLKTMLGSAIRGDSLDVPFMNCIKCHTFEHGISGAGHGYADRSGKALGQSWGTDWGIKERSSWGTAKNTASFLTGAPLNVAAAVPAYIGRGIGAAVGAKHTGGGTAQLGLYDDGPAPGDLVDGKMPTHGSVAFSKNLDSASPQLSFGCSAQERFPIAVFFLRKKTGFKVAGVTHPHTVIAYRNCMVTDWATNGDTETVSLNYEKMGMASFLQIADTPVPQGISWRHWDNVNKVGGEAGWSALLVPLTALVVAAGGLAVTAAAAASGSGEGFVG